MDIRVLAVYKLGDEPGRWTAELQAGNVIFRMQLIDGKAVIVSRRHIDAQIFDPDNLWVPRKVYAEIYRRGAAILREREHRAQCL